MSLSNNTTTLHRAHQNKIQGDQDADRLTGIFIVWEINTCLTEGKFDYFMFHTNLHKEFSYIPCMQEAQSYLGEDNFLLTPQEQCPSYIGHKNASYIFQPIPASINPMPHTMRVGQGILQNKDNTFSYLVTNKDIDQ